MKHSKKWIPLLALPMLFLAAFVLVVPDVKAATVDVKVPTKLTDNTNYGRNPSIVK